MKDPKLIEEVEKGLEDGVVHTLTADEKVQAEENFKEREQNAYLSALILMTATFHQMEELAELGATKMLTKNHLNKTIKSMEKDLDSIFDLGQESVDIKAEQIKTMSKEEIKELIKKQKLDLAKYVENGAEQLRKIVLQYVKN